MNPLLAALMTGIPDGERDRLSELIRQRQAQDDPPRPPRARVEHGRFAPADAPSDTRAQ